MKKTFLLICLAAGLLSCTKELTPQEETPAGVPMNFEINIAGTKAGKTAWAKNDVVHVFFNGLGEKYLKLTYNGSSWDNSSEGGTLVDTDFATLGNNTLTAVHIPVPVNVFPGKTMGDFYISYEDDAAPFTYYFFDAQKAYSVDGTTVTASISLRKPEGFVLFHIPDIEVSAYRFRSPQMWAGGCSAVSAEGRVRTIYSENPNVTIRGIAEGDGGTFAGWVDTENALDYTFTLEGPTNTYTYTCSDKQFEEGKLYNFPVLTNTNWTVTTTTHQYVDLGLPSGRLWATMNVGASTPEDYGDYFAWAETAPKETYTWNNLQYRKSNGTYQKYTGSDYSYLQAEDDAAQVNWGGDWRTPTKEDWEELFSHYFPIPVSSSDGNAAEGILLIRSYLDMSKSLFLPANGVKNDMGHEGLGTNGYYWSSTLNTNTPGQAYQFTYSNNSGSILARPESRSRYLGSAVRPVK